MHVSARLVCSRSFHPVHVSRLRLAFPVISALAVISVMVNMATVELKPAPEHACVLSSRYTPDSPAGVRLHAGQLSTSHFVTVSAVLATLNFSRKPLSVAHQSDDSTRVRQQH